MNKIKVISVSSSYLIFYYSWTLTDSSKVFYLDLGSNDAVVYGLIKKNGRSIQHTQVISRDNYILVLLHSLEVSWQNILIT